MRLLDLFESYRKDSRPWLILGKGPTFSVPSQEISMSYNLITINHTINKTIADVSLVIDWDVIDNCGESIYQNAKTLWMPYYPHFGYHAHPQMTLEEWSLKHPILSKMRNESRLYGFNLSTIKTKIGDSPIIRAVNFTSEAAVNILGKLGVKRIRTLGIDGGKSRALEFSNGLDNDYSSQFNEIRKAILKYNLDYAPLGVESPIRIFVGAGQAQLIPALVLKHSILKHTTMSTEVTPMIDWTHPLPKNTRNWPRTPFSFQRFMIPEKCGYKGYAIYMDSDMLVFSDIKEIWAAHQEIAKSSGSGHDPEILVMRGDDIDKHKAQFSVFSIDCQKVLWNIEKVIENLDTSFCTYEDLVFKLQGAGDGYSLSMAWNPDWNSLEEYTEGKTKLLHYTEMYNQPWLANPNHPLGYLWFKELKEAVDDGSVTREIIQDHIAKGYILPKCLEVLNG